MQMMDCVPPKLHRLIVFNTSTAELKIEYNSKTFIKHHKSQVKNS